MSYENMKTAILLLNYLVLGPSVAVRLHIHTIEKREDKLGRI